MNEYTPTTDDVREDYALGRYGDRPGDTSFSESRTDFDRWLAAHDAEIRADQIEKDAVIAESRHFGTDQIASLNRWGAKQAAAAIRAQNVTPDGVVP